MPEKTLCDCCGACCSSFPIFASEGDAFCEPRIKEEACLVAEWETKEDKKFQLHPLPFHTACCFLGKDRLCKIYATRPEVCRKFEAGSDQCNEARLRVGLTPLHCVGN